MAISNIGHDAYKQAMESMQAERTASRGLRKTSATARSTDSKGEFGKVIADSLKTVNDLQSQKHTMVQEFASGEKQNVHELMITLQKAGLAMRMTSAVRNKVMEAYKELSRMSF